MSDVHQCPFCELRFQAKWELTAHLDADHPGRIREKERGGAVTVEEPDGDRPEPL